MKEIKFRPHHLLCSRFFIGKGYSEEFSQNMYEVLAELAKNPNIKIIEGKDDLCSHCPNWKIDKCVTQEKVLRYDNRVLEELNIKYQDIVDNKELTEKINPRALIEKVCSDCAWYTICHK